jgi:histidinol-phosphate/aromatic aminotransferase/cobyric acid decarboxylase-like protein
MSPTRVSFSSHLRPTVRAREENHRLIEAATALRGEASA